MATTIQLDVDADIQDIPTLATYLLKKVEDLALEIEQRCQTLGTNGVLQLAERDRYLLGLVTAYEEVLGTIGYKA